MTDAPTAHIQRKPRRSLSLIWLVPIVAAIAGGVLLVRNYRAQGPEITISFLTATGVSAGKTEVRYKEVVVGKVTDVQLGADDNVLVKVALRNSASRLAVTDSQFWVVRPRVDTSGVSGLGTLLSGAYIGVDAGASNQRQHRFTGLESPPPVGQSEKGTRFQLIGTELGSLDVGSPVYYRHLEAGQVAKYELDDHGEQISLELFIRPPFDKFVNRQTRFWNASGINVSVAGGSVSLETQSLTTILLGGIAFGNPPGMDDRAKISPHPEQLFTLFNGQTTAMAATPLGDSLIVEFQFEQSIAGLSSGARVQFLGLEMGKVIDIEVDYLPEQQRFYGIVTAELTPQKLGSAYYNLLDSIEAENRNVKSLLKLLIGQGLRAQMQSANILTGQQQIVLSILPDAEPPESIFASNNTLRIPTVPSALDALQVQVASLLKKFQQVPISELAGELRGMMQDARATIARLEQTVDTAVTDFNGNVDNTMRTARTAMNNAGDTFVTLNQELLPTTQTAVQKLGDATEKISATLENTIGDEDAVLITELRSALQEADRALRAVRTLADSVKRDPQQMLLGKDEPRNPFDNPRAPSAQTPRAAAPARNDTPTYNGPRR